MPPRGGPESLPRPTAAELRILRVLWRLGPSTVRQVLDVLERERETGYTTVLKLLQIMVEKRLVTREDSRRPHVFRAAVDEARTQRQLLGTLIDGAFGGSAHRLVLRALESGRVSKAEVEEIRSLLDELERKGERG